MTARATYPLVLALLLTPGLAACDQLLRMEEWYCQDGEAPYRTQDGSTYCVPEGSELPAGATWDPLGNRPLTHSCEQVKGWTPIVHTDGRADCAREGSTLPEGWSFQD